MNYFQSLNKILNHPLNKNQKIKTFFRISWWKINQLFFKLPILVQFTKEMSIICEPNSSYGSYIVYAKFPEYKEMRFIYDYLEINDIYLDVGAHIGSEILLAASKIKKGKIYGFEPTAEIFRKLKVNLRLNGLENRVEIFKKIVSDQNGFEKFILEQESEVNHIANDIKGKKYKYIPSITLDVFLQSKKIKFINFLKIDVEGAEEKVLKGLQKSLQKKKIGVILFEINWHLFDYKSSPQRLLALLKNFDYEIYQITNKIKLKKINSKKFRLNKTINLLAVAKLPKVQARIKSWRI